MSNPTGDALKAYFASAAACNEEALRAAAIAGWNACRREVYLLSEDYTERTYPLKSDDTVEGHFHRGQYDVAKSFARAFNSFEAVDCKYFNQIDFVALAFSVKPAPQPVAPEKNAPNFKRYTLPEIREKIASHDYNAEQLLQHAMLILGEISPPVEQAPQPVAHAACEHEWFDCSNSAVESPTKSCRKCGWTVHGDQETVGLFIQWPWLSTPTEAPPVEHSQAVAAGGNLEGIRAQAIEDVLSALTAHELYKYRPKAFEGFIQYARENLVNDEEAKIWRSNSVLAAEGQE